MRLYLSLSRNNEVIPFNYQQYLTGAIHKWIGSNNQFHNHLSLYSFSWLQNVNTNKNGIDLTGNSYFFISAFNDSLIKKVTRGILEDSSFCFGSYITDVQISEDPLFSNNQTFSVASPVFIKRRLENKEKHITYNDVQCNEFLTKTLKKKLITAGLYAEGVTVKFDTSHSNPYTKVIFYKNIGNRVNICPVIIEGTTEQIAFAWNVGVGNSTGIGFGALK